MLRDFDQRDFAHADDLCHRAQQLHQRIAVVIPTLNESATIGAIVSSLRQQWMMQHPLLEAIHVIDSGSSDDTLARAAAAGATTHLAASIAPEHGHHAGKGENLWKAQFICDADIICCIDGDIRDFDAQFIAGLVGPLLWHADLHFVKAHYRRPLEHDQGISASGGGRVSKILMRPLLSLLYPELCAFFQPLAGEFAMRREWMHQLPFPVGYGIEVAHLIDIFHNWGLQHCAQSNLGVRRHRHQSDAELGRMAFCLLRTCLLRAQRDGKVELIEQLGHHFLAKHVDETNVTIRRAELATAERPPFAQIASVSNLSLIPVTPSIHESD